MGDALERIPIWLLTQVTATQKDLIVVVVVVVVGVGVGVVD
jgi:hypothetical protein